MKIEKFIQIALLSLPGALLAATGCSCSKSDETKGSNAAETTEQSSAPIKSKEACTACEKADQRCSQLATVCDTLEGDAKEGPKAGTSKKKLCQDAMACMERSNCAGSDVSHCYCGADSKGTECLEGKAHGACKAELEAALESTDAAQVAVRFDHGEYAGRPPIWRFQCLHDKCEKQCF